MRVAMLAAGNSIHSIRWANALARRGHEVHLITIHKPIEDISEGIYQHLLDLPAPVGYYLNVFSLRRLLKKIMPDILHVHYASGYGTLARLCGYKPLLLSVWGSDVYDFPVGSSLKEYTLRKNLASALRISSTSYDMKKQTEKYVDPRFPIEVIPFGVDKNIFRPQLNRDENKITIGMLKRMMPVYGPRYLIEAFRVIYNKYPISRLVLVGGGQQEQELKQLADRYGIMDRCKFIGSIPHNEVPKWLNKFDIYCAPSVLESFGVAVIEASACGVPVIVSGVGGLPEVVQEGQTGLIVPPRDVDALVQALDTLIKNKKLRMDMGKAGVKFVRQNYDWECCVDKMEQLYQKMVEA